MDACALRMLKEVGCSVIRAGLRCLLDIFVELGFGSAYVPGMAKNFHAHLEF
jgi:hypothetical protein